MVTKSKRWPNNAEWARMDSITLAEDAHRILDALLDELDSAHLVRQVGRAMKDLQEIRYKLTVCRDDENQTKEIKP